MKRVVIINRVLPQYRLEFFSRLRDSLAAHDVELVLVYGDGEASERAKGDLVDLEWGHAIRNRRLSAGKLVAYWQPALGYLHQADLVIVEQANKLILNYLLQIGQGFGGPRVAFWGHGRNFQAISASSPAEAFKKLLSRRVHWWFAYNDLSAQVVRENGFPAEKITVVQNAIDTKSLRSAVANVDSASKITIRDKYGVRGSTIGVYFGALYPAKRLPFLIEAAKLVRDRIPDFELLIVGDGVHRTLVENESRSHSWLKYLGPRFGTEKAEILAIGDVFLLPGLVGLAILDAFAAGLPIITTESASHGPEIAYLEPFANGIMTPPSLAGYVDAVAGLLTEPERLSAMSKSALSAGGHYTLENMVTNFSNGIQQALEAT
ncbi:MAG TPA: glycosyltransferase family 4 protein [Trueperaceae bacterium]|nr:glycosyltransferase family 4 protein [Trueperaceae bacterium]